MLIPQADLTWLIRPERSPMPMLPFRTPASSLADVKALVESIDHVEDDRITWQEFGNWLIKEGVIRNIAND